MSFFIISIFDILRGLGNFRSAPGYVTSITARSVTVRNKYDETDLWCFARSKAST